MDHIRDGHNVPGEISLEMLFPPWTVTRQLSLFHDEDETLNCTGHSEADGYALVRHIPQIYTAVFVLIAGCEWDDAICSKDRDAA